LDARKANVDAAGILGELTQGPFCNGRAVIRAQPIFERLYAALKRRSAKKNLRTK
jgi:hypothetical protein